MKRALFVLYFLSLVPEEEVSWGGHWSPLQYAWSFLSWNPLKIPMFDLAIIIMLIATKDRAPQRRVRGMEKTIKASIAALLVWFGWGMYQGGESYQVQFQLHSLVLSYVLAFAMAKILATPEDYFALGKVLFGASVYRSCTCIAFYISKVSSGGKPPEVCTSHGDTVLFVAGLVSALAYLLVRWGNIKRKTAILLGVGIVLLVLAIQFNNRRLAWVSLTGSLILMYFFVPTGRFKKKVNRRLLMFSPVIILYVVIGTGRPERIFSPLSALASVKSDTDYSTKSRDAENMGLLVTLGQHPFMGTGWGHKYIEVDSTLSAGASGFVQYRYMPHNGVLALLAFTGFMGFAAIWMVFPMAAFCHTSAHRIGVKPAIRIAAIVGTAEVLIVMNQWWGDLGLTFQTPMLVMAGSFAGAIRLPAFAKLEADAASGKLPITRPANDPPVEVPKMHDS